MRFWTFWTLSAVILLSGCSVDPSKHENLGPPQVVMSAYTTAIEGKLEDTQKYFSPEVQQGLKDGGFTLKDVWSVRLLKGNVKAIKVSNQKDAGPERFIIEGHVVLGSGMIQEIEELVVKADGLWVITGKNPKYSPGMPEMTSPTGIWAEDAGMGM